MAEDKRNHCEFRVKSCSLSAIATGIKAGSLSELKDRLLTIDESCIYYHFWGSRLHPQFVHPEWHNDFAKWCSVYLHDNALAEKLNIIDPTAFESYEGLRQKLIETIDERLDSYEIMYWTKRDNQFCFIKNIVVVFDTPIKINSVEELPSTVENLPPSSIYYHFIEARNRIKENIDDFSRWLKMYGKEYQNLITDISKIDPFFLSLTELKNELVITLHKHLKR